VSQVTVVTQTEVAATALLAAAQVHQKILTTIQVKSKFLARSSS